MAEHHWPFIGRRAVLADVIGALRDSRLVLRGHAGVGKSRLLDEAVTASRDDGIVVHEIRATTAAATIPFGAAAHLLPEGVAGTDPALLATAAAAMADAGLRAALAIDDADRLDPQSAALVHHVALRTDIPIVATARTGASAPDAVRRLWTDGIADVRELPALSDDELSRLVLAVLEGPVDSALTAELVRLSDGNPLLLRQVLRTARQAGRIRREQSIWQASGSLVVGSDLPQVVAEQLAGLPDGVRTAAELVALGEPLEGDVLLATTDRSTAEALEATGLVVATQDRRRLVLRLEHPLVGEAVRARLGPLRRARLHGQLADAAADTPCRRQGDVVRRGVWELRRDGHGDHEVLLAAAEAARDGQDRALAADLAEAAVTAGAGVPARLLLAECLPWRGEHSRASDLLDELAETVTDASQRVPIHELRAHQMVRQGRDEEADRLLQTTIAEVDAEAAAALHGLRGRIAWAAGRVDRALEIGQRAVREAGEPAALRAGTAWILIRALTCAGRTEDAQRIADALIEVLGATPDLDGLRQLVEMAGLMASAYGGEASTTASVAARRHAASMRGPQFLRVMWSHELGQVSVIAGRPQTAIRVLDEVAALFPFDVLGDAGRQWIRDALAHAHALLGDAAAAREQLEILTEAGGADDRRLRHSGAVWTLAAEGRTDDAVALATAQATRTEEVGGLASAAWLLDDAARLGAADAVVDDLERIAAQVQGTLVPDLAAFARGLADGNSQLLADVGQRFAEAGFDLHAAEAVASAARLVERDDDDPGDLRARATTLRNRTEGATTPLLRSAEEVPHLTPRETEVAHLAADGRTDRQIADALHVSIRTVQTHLHRAYTKLGIGGRTRLPDVLA